MYLYIPLEWEKYYKSILSKIEKSNKNKKLYYIKKGQKYYTLKTTFTFIIQLWINLAQSQFLFYICFVMKLIFKEIYFLIKVFYFCSKWSSIRHLKWMASLDENESWKLEKKVYISYLYMAERNWDIA